MKTNNLIHIEKVCTHCKVDLSFIQSLSELGHIELIVESNDYYISEENLKPLESLINFHTELHINIEGIDTIAHLLKKIEVLQGELLIAKNRLNVNTGE
jgi:chaperone modulatory protein CbpM